METIKSKREFDQVFTYGHRAGHRLVRATVLSDAASDGKVAFVAARRLGTAVYRNRCKRVLREAARVCGLPYAGSKVILFATRATHDSTPAEVAPVIARVVERATRGA